MRIGYECGTPVTGEALEGMGSARWRDPVSGNAPVLPSSKDPAVRAQDASCGWTDSPTFGGHSHFRRECPVLGSANRWQLQSIARLEANEQNCSRPCSALLRGRPPRRKDLSPPTRRESEVCPRVDVEHIKQRSPKCNRSPPA